MKRTSRVVAAAGLSAGLALAGAGIALADPVPTPTLAVSPTTVAPGGTLTATLSGFEPGERIWFELSLWGDQADGGSYYAYTAIASGVTSGPDGSVSTTVRVPANTPAGQASLFAYGDVSYNYAHGDAVITVTGDSPLPSVTVEPKLAAPGDEITVAAAGFEPGQEVEIWAPSWNNGSIDDVLTRKIADSSGAVSSKVRVPADAGGVRTTIRAEASARSGALDESFRRAASTILYVFADDDSYATQLAPGSATATQGGALSLTLGGFLPGEQVEIGVFSGYQKLTVLAADDSGDASGTVTLPTDLSIGKHTIRAVGLTSARWAAVQINVTAKKADRPKGGSGLPKAANDAPVE